MIGRRNDRAEDLRRGTTIYIDGDGQVTDDPARAVRGEVVYYDTAGRPVKRASFFLEQGEIPWLPIAEPAFLLWVLALLVALWVVVAVVLRLT